MCDGAPSTSSGKRPPPLVAMSRRHPYFIWFPGELVAVAVVNQTYFDRMFPSYITRAWLWLCVLEYSQCRSHHAGSFHIPYSYAIQAIPAISSRWLPFKLAEQDSLTLHQLTIITTKRRRHLDAVESACAREWTPSRPSQCHML